MDMMEKYADHLEDLVTERTQLLHEEKLKTEDLLHRMLPKYVFLLPSLCTAAAFTSELYINS